MPSRLPKFRPSVFDRGEGPGSQLWDTFAATAFKDDGFRLNSAALDEMGKSRTWKLI